MPFFPSRDENRSERRSGFVCQREFKELKNSLTQCKEILENFVVSGQYVKEEIASSYR